MKISKAISALMTSAALVTTFAAPAFAAISSTLYGYTDASTAVSQTVFSGEALNVFTFDLYDRGAEDVVVQQITLNYSGINNGDEVQNITLFDNTGKVFGIAPQILNKQLVYSNLHILIKKGTVKRLAVKVNVAQAATAGETFQFSVANAVSYGASTANNIAFKFPASMTNKGNMFTVVEYSAQLNISKSPSIPAQTLVPGYNIPVMDFNVSSTGAAVLKKMTFEFNSFGTVPATFRIVDKVTKQVLAQFVPKQGTNTVYFWNTVYVAKGSAKTLEVTADIFGSTPGSVFTVNASDVQAVDVVTGEIVQSTGNASNVLTMY